MAGYYVLVAPLALLLPALLFRFVGCTTTVTGTGFLLFQLNMDPDLQKAVPPDTREVKNITVFWSLWQGGTLLKTVPVPSTVINPLNPDFLDPTLDKGAQYSANAYDVGTADHVSCTCALILNVPASSAPDESETVHSTPLLLEPGKANYVFTLTPKSPKTPGTKRDFVLTQYSV
jgi:hypothetical protein